MDKDKSAVADFLDEFDKDKAPFTDHQEDPFTSEQVAEEPVEEPKEEKPLPFNKDPKIQKFIEKELDKRLKDFKVEAPQEPQKESDDYYVRLIGNDTPEKVAMIKEAMARDERMLSLAEERALSKLSQKEQEALQADQEAEQELENAFENIEDTFAVDITSNAPIAKKTRQEFVSFVEKIAPKNNRGEIVDYPDMTSAWETFSEIKKAQQTPSRAKELASRSLTRSAETTSQAKVVNKSAWESTDNFLETLGK